MQFKNSILQADWNGWVEHGEDSTDPIEQDAVWFGRKFVELAEVRIDSGDSLTDCWRALVTEAKKDTSLNDSAIQAVLGNVVAAWRHGDDLAKVMLG